ncbi:hypothetical protein J3R03_005788 [Actinoplanes couchii]|nr:hypothetical protein [Actinoplanes couchii]
MAGLLGSGLLRSDPSVLGLSVPGWLVPGFLLSGLPVPGLLASGLPEPGWSVPGWLVPGWSVPGLLLSGLSVPGSVMLGWVVLGSAGLGAEVGVGSVVADGGGDFSGAVAAVGHRVAGSVRPQPPGQEPTKPPAADPSGCPGVFSFDAGSGDGSDRLVFSTGSLSGLFFRTESAWIGSAGSGSVSALVLFVGGSVLLESGSGLAAGPRTGSSASSCEVTGRVSAADTVGVGASVAGPEVGASLGCFTAGSGRGGFSSFGTVGRSAVPARGYLPRTVAFGAVSRASSVDSGASAVPPAVGCGWSAAGSPAPGRRAALSGWSAWLPAPA